MGWQVRSQCIYMKPKWWHREPRWKNEGNEWSKISWRRELIGGRKVNDQMTKGKNCDSVAFKLSTKAKEIFIHIFLMKHSKSRRLWFLQFLQFYDEPNFLTVHCMCMPLHVETLRLDIRKIYLLKEWLNAGKSFPWN